MIDFDNAFRSVTSVTGISRTKILSPSRVWEIQEARMLFVLLNSRLGQPDSTIALVLKRNRTTVLKSRHAAEEYITISRSFSEKFTKISAAYDRLSQIPVPQK